MTTSISSEAIVAKGLGYSYRKRKQKHFIESASLINLSFRVPHGAVVAILGASGSGKTTLLKVLGLLLDPREVSGELSFDGCDCCSLSQSEQADFRSRKFGFVFQAANMLSAFSCLDNVLLTTRLQRPDRRQQMKALRTAIESLCGDGRQRKEILEVLRKRPSQISGGQRQRMAVLRAVTHNPDVVFADEPCASLDAVNSQQVMRLLLRWQCGGLSETKRESSNKKTLFLVTHNIKQALAVAEYFLILHKGQLIGGSAFHQDQLPKTDGEFDLGKIDDAMNDGVVKGFSLND